MMMSNNKKQSGGSSGGGSGTNRFKGYLSNSKTLSCVFNALKGTQITIQLRNESEIYGTVDSVDKALNIELRNATITKGYDYRLLMLEEEQRQQQQQQQIQQQKQVELLNQIDIQDHNDTENSNNNPSTDDTIGNEQGREGNDEIEEGDIVDYTSITNTTSTDTPQPTIVSTLILTKEILSTMKQQQQQQRVYDLLLVSSRNIRYIHIPDRIDLNHLLFIYSKSLVKNREKYQRTKRKPPTEKAIPSLYVHDDGSTLIQQQTDYKKKS